jgi:hypothetical protein
MLSLTQRLHEASEMEQRSVTTSRGGTTEVSAHREFLAATLAAWVLWGGVVGLLLGSRRASRGRLPLNAPVSDDKAARLSRVGSSLLPRAKVGTIVMTVVFVALLICTLVT